MLSEKENSKYVETPLMKQYYSIKQKYPDAILLFRVGDFYETFGDDAIKTSEILGIVLTKRANGAASYVELAGFPHHSIETYLPKLVRAGYRVAICDQLEDPKLAKKIVKRGVTELVTPGVAYSDKVLDHKSNNFLAGIHFDAKLAGMALLDVSTGEFYIAQGNLEYVDKLIQSFKPAEIVLQKSNKKNFIETFGDKFCINTFDDWVFTKDFTYELLTKHFGTTSLKGYGVENMELGIIAAGACMHYLAETQHDQIKHICKISRIEEENHVWLDRFTIRNLELFQTMNEKAFSLLDVIDHTTSPMGSRMLKRWLALPLKEKSMIEERLNAVEFLMKEQDFAEKIQSQIKQMGDVERLVSRVSVGKITPREVLQLLKALHAIDFIKNECQNANEKTLKIIAEQLNNCKIIRDRIEKEIHPDAPVLLNKGNVIATGVNAELDELRTLLGSGKDYLNKILERETIATGIPSLKISFNNVFGYYLEVTNTHKNKVPSTWIRKQTLVNAERYITEELKQYEEKILGAEEKIQQLENKLFNELIIAITAYIEPLLLNASLIAKLDCLLSFAVLAKKNKYVKPSINETLIIDIKNGRHPVIEQQLPPDNPYIGNDVYLDPDKQQIIMLTGPNMSGKSALLRQTALIVLLAQMGSFVPADNASIGIVDKIFTRVGASDNLSSGESTFMVEMNETASILNNISNRSLILLDEIGRGTSTYDGISIAWAIAEFLHEHPQFRPKTLFATHYHELNEMATTYPRIKNFHISIKEVHQKIIFLRKMLPGGSEHSFGIHVAKMAGMPNLVVSRANEVLAQLEKSHSSEQLSAKTIAKKKTSVNDNYQLSFIQLDDPLLLQIKEEILKTDINTLTPVEALMKLNEIKKLLGSK